MSMPAIRKNVHQVSQDYLDGYHAAKDLFRIFDPFHYYNLFISEDYRVGYERSLNNSSQILKRNFK